MKRPPSGSHFVYKEFPKSEYLSSISKRLANELGFYIELIESNQHSSGAGVGFWSGVRMIMPVIEAVAEVEEMKIEDFMGEALGIPVPALTWRMFRHALIHNDQLQHAIYQDRTINWGISLTIGGGHIMMHDHIGVDIKTLYTDLQTYLEQKTQEGDTSLVKIAVGFEYDNPPDDILKELELLK